MSARWVCWRLATPCLLSARSLSDTKIKEFLFCAGEVADKCTPIPPEGFQLLVIVQNLFSITCVFFIGLALCNYFRIK
jgi:hypothetical protein